MVRWLSTDRVRGGSRAREMVKYGQRRKCGQRKLEKTDG